MAEVLNVEARDTRGKRNARRLRLAGKIPAVLYGHGQETVALSLSADEIDAAVRHGVRLISLTGAVTDQAFVRELQWDTWGKHVLHVDFTRVSAHEKVRVQVVVELRGEAPGMKQGGVVKQLIHEVPIECEVTALPEKLYVNINHLNLDDSITIGSLDLPPTVTILVEPEMVVVQCVQPVEVEEEGAAAESVEPEVIGRKKEEEEEAEDK
jgi:large subunit ribosomal protein L25